MSASFLDSIKALLSGATSADLDAAKAALSDEVMRRTPALLMDEVITFTDGAARGNPGQAGAGVLLFHPNGEKIMEDFQYLGECTNNEAEYRALLRALEHAEKRTKGTVSCFMDSELLVRQLTGVYRIKSENLMGFYNDVKNRIGRFERVTFTHVPREHPRLQMADKLANKAIDEFNKKGANYGR